MENKSTWRNYIATQTIIASPFDRVVTDSEMNGEVLEGYNIRYSYSDGHVDTWMSKKRFEETYVPVTGFTFGQGLEVLRLGHRISRLNWKSNEYLQMSEYAGKSIIIFVREFEETNTSDISIWTPSHEDLLGTDYHLVPDFKKDDENE